MEIDDIDGAGEPGFVAFAACTGRLVRDADGEWTTNFWEVGVVRDGEFDEIVAASPGARVRRVGDPTTLDRALRTAAYLRARVIEGGTA